MDSYTPGPFGPQPNTPPGQPPTAGFHAPATSPNPHVPVDQPQPYGSPEQSTQQPTPQPPQQPPTDPPGPGGEQGEQREHKPHRRRALKITVISLCVLLVAGGSAGVWLYHRLSGNIRNEDLSHLSNRPKAAKANSAGQTPLNIMVMGSDSREGNLSHLGGGKDDGARSDTAFLMHISADRKSAIAMSVPRDTMMPIPSCPLKNGRQSRAHRLEMFNSAFQIGGPLCTVATVEKLTDLRIDHFLVVNFQGFVDIVDAIGGVPIYLPKKVNDRSGNIKLKAGCHTVEGKEALDYVRLRHDDSLGGNGNDLDRIKRQQAFVSSMIQKVKSTGVLLNPARLYGLLDSSTKAITTDKELGTPAALATLASDLRALQPKDIKFTTLPTRPWPRDRNRLEPVRAQAQPIFDAIRSDLPLPDGSKPAGKSVPPTAVPVQVVATTGSKAKSIKAGLARLGFPVKAATGDSKRHNETLIQYDPAQLAQAKTLAAAVPGAKLQPKPGLKVVTLVVGSKLRAIPGPRSKPKPVEATPANQQICR